MALFKQLRGNRASLNTQPLHDGYAYFCIDDGSFWIDYNDNGELKRKRINAAELDSKIGVVDDTIEITALNGIEMNGPTHIIGDTNVEGALYQDGDAVATQDWVRANAGGGTVDDSNYAKLDSANTFYASNGYSVTIDPNATNPIVIDAGLGTDNPNGLKVESNMMYTDATVYKSTGISATIANDYGNSTQTVTNLQFPRNENSASTITNTLNVPNSSGTIATEEWVKNYINTVLLGGKW